MLVNTIIVVSVLKFNGRLSYYYIYAGEVLIHVVPGFGIATGVAALTLLLSKLGQS
jgi:hypothetical protein